MEHSELHSSEVSDMCSAAIMIDPISVIISSITDPISRAPSSMTDESRVAGAKRRLSLNASVTDRLNSNLFIHLKRHQGSAISALVHEAFDDVGADDGIVHLIYSRRESKMRPLPSLEVHRD